MTERRTRANGEGSIYPHRNGFAAYTWVTKPDGKRARKYVYGATRAVVHEKWVKLMQQAAQGPVASVVPTVDTYVAAWLAEVVLPTLAPSTADNYATYARLYVLPTLGPKRLDRLSVREVQGWVNGLTTQCQCCAQEKDAARPLPRCCAAGRCCGQTLSARTIRDAWATLRAALGNAMRDELIGRNVATLVRMPSERRRKAKPWTVDEARQFLESALRDGDPLYGAYVLLLVLGLRRGELLGLGWADVDRGASTLTVQWQVQRVGGQLVRRQTKTEASDATLPLPDPCPGALAHVERVQESWRIAAGQAWHDYGLIFTTRYGLALEPRNFHRSFKTRCAKAGVRPVPVHSTRRTCASLLAALDVHPRIAMQILRHSQIAVTMNVYTEVYSKDTLEALRRLGAALGDLP